MTCIVGFVEGHTVWMGSDSAGVSGWDLRVRADKKLFRNGPMLMGFTTSFRMGQLLRYALSVPDHDPCVDVEKWMATTFVDAVRDCLKGKGWAEREKEQERGGQFLVAYQQRLFSIEADYQVAIAVDGCAALGCGYTYALGALFATPQLKGKKRIEMALRAAESMSAGVRGPFHIESLSS